MALLYSSVTPNCHVFYLLNGDQQETNLPTRLLWLDGHDLRTLTAAKAAIGGPKQTPCQWIVIVGKMTESDGAAIASNVQTS